MPLHEKQFKNPEFLGFVEHIPKQKKYLLESFMPSQTTKDVNFAYGVIDGKYAKAASITGFNASAPLRDRKELSKAYASVAKVQHGFRLDEELLMQFNRPRDDEEMNQVIEYIYNSTDELTQGVYDVEEYLRAQAIYNGKLNYNDTLNDIQVDVDFGIPEENNITASKDWTSADAEPLTDIANAIEQYEKANNRRKPSVMHMTDKTESILLKNEQVRVQIYGTEPGKRLVTKDDLANVFSGLGFPPYSNQDDVAEVNDGGEEPLLEDGKIVFLGSELGNTMFGPTVEKNFESGIYVVTDIQETNPPQQAVFVGETVFPALKNPRAIVTLDVGTP